MQSHLWHEKSNSFGLIDSSFLMLAATLRKLFTLNISKKNKKINLTCLKRIFSIQVKGFVKIHHPHSVSFKNSWNIHNDNSLNKTHVIILMTFFDISLGIYMLFGFIRKLRTFLVKLNINLKLSLYTFFIQSFLQIFQSLIHVYHKIDDVPCSQ